MKPHTSRPKARQDGLLVRPLQEDTIVYDLDRHEGHCLNRAAAAVWRACDGETSIATIATETSRELDRSVDDTFVIFTLRRLERAHLLVAPLEANAGHVLSRRDLSRRLGLTGAFAALLPTVISIVAPTAAAAASACGTNGACTTLNCCCTNHQRCNNNNGTLQCQGNPCTP